MAEMAAAAAAMYFGADHAPAPIGRGLDRAGLGIVEARPAGAAVEFRLRDEQLLPAGGASEGAGAFFVIQRAAARPLGAVLAHDVKLFRREDFAPFRLGMRNGICLGFKLSGHDARLFSGGTK